ncbi:hypothetical protein, partial [Aeromonas caviae]|uniref:hypothetical protein n=1 Tax=Aeromonas caviae TaxID=648 RepID=UPI003014A327
NTLISTDNSWVNMGVAQKPRSWPRWVNFTPALVGHFYIGGDIFWIDVDAISNWFHEVISMLTTT